MKRYYRNMTFRVVLGIAFLIVILIEHKYILSLHGFYSLLVVLGLVWLWEKTSKL
jgi:hypothetical protein